MVMCRGPMFSIEAHGQFGKCIVYQKNASGSIARMYLPYRHKYTFKQGVHRSEYGNAIADWRLLPDIIKLAYHDAAVGSGMSSVALWVKEWFVLRYCCRYGVAVYDISVFDMANEYKSYPEKVEDEYHTSG